ncbi:DUF1826 domain-containing protein [uncultured Sphingomonas sp.]|uniref:DUF1826 domain-containing protein n=1 Tax=uncultured Sphingomonas sp. TaxID=158754 RepID=UPI00262796DF|nr:DUF1826 domain-containing protein [uncultured Sphingomonas sp.]
MSVAALEAGLVAEGRDAAILNQIIEDTTHLAIWHRAATPGLDGIGALDWNAIDDLDFSTPVAELDGEIAEGLAEAGYPAALCPALRDEIAMLARRFAAIMACDAVTIRLEIIETDACRRFHTDNVAARLLTTLHGPTTQWIVADAPDTIRQLPAYGVAVFKGRRLAERPEILHRSPPIAGTGDTRLLLVIDPFDPAADEARVP